MQFFKDNILNISQLNVGYRTNQHENLLIEHIDLTVKTPKLIGILGKNGVGKSTFLRTLAGIQPELSGEICFFDKNSKDYTPLEFAKIKSVVLTEPLNDSHFTVSEMVSMGRMVYTNSFNQLNDNDLVTVNTALQQLQLQEISHQYFAEISDGQRQKTKIATAFCQMTPILLLDEPTLHLDINHGMELLVLFKKWVTDFRKTILLTTHDIQGALTWCDEIWLLFDKKIIIGTPKEIIENQYINQIFVSENVIFDSENLYFKYQNFIQ